MTPCPVQTLQLQATSLGGEMLRVLRRLRLETKACGTCPQGEDCPTRSELNSQIDIAIGEIAAEWGIGQAKSQAV